MNKYVSGSQKYYIEKNIDGFRQAAKAYILNSIDTYLKLEGKPRIYQITELADTANVICSLNRAIEHLLKLKLYKIDPLLIYPLPKKFEEYCKIKGINIYEKDRNLIRRFEREYRSRTIPFREAYDRVLGISGEVNFPLSCFKEINALRNNFEHHWDRDDSFLKKIYDKIPTDVIPCIIRYIDEILEEDPTDYIDEKLIEEVDRIGRAILSGNSLNLQRRLEEQTALYQKNPEECRKKYPVPFKYNIRYAGLPDEETDIECPICKEHLIVLWDWEADYDVDGSGGYISGAYPDAKCLFCGNCHLLIEGSDTDTYLPDGLDVEIEPQDFELY